MERDKTHPIVYSLDDTVDNSIFDILVSPMFPPHQYISIVEDSLG